MRLVPRLLVLGVGLPMTGLIVALAIAGSLFRRSLLRDVDERLFAQAAVESVSLFDGPGGKPHVHIPKSPLASEVAAFAPKSLLYSPDGHLVSEPANSRVAPPVFLRAPPAKPRIDTPDSHTRTLTVGVERPDEGIYTLHLIASLDPVEATMNSFYRSVGAAVACIALFVFGVLYSQAHQLTRRVRELIGFVPLLRAARPPERPPAGGYDELADLGVTLTEAAEFIHAQQSAQERFLANAAHQLRTPLAVLTTEIDIALRRPRAIEELRDALEQARTETDRLTLLARKLLDFESLRVQKPETLEVDLRQVVRELVERHTASATVKGLALREDGDACLPCRCDPLLISQAIGNLLDNALRFAPAGSVVEVRSTCGEGVCRVSVHDDGPGIPADEQEKVFEPFFRGAAAGSQTGLGLAFVADVARKHGGTARLEPTASGTTVSIELPCSRDSQ